jgi:hypothetical protein
LNRNNLNSRIRMQDPQPSSQGKCSVLTTYDISIDLRSVINMEYKNLGTSFSPPLLL